MRGVHALGRKTLLHLLFPKRRPVVRYNNTAKLADGIFGTCLVELLEFADLLARQPVGGALNVRAVDLLHPLQFQAFFADLKAVNRVEERVPIFLFQIHETGIIITVTFGRRQAQQGRVFHRQDRHNDFEKERRINVGRLIDDNYIGACSAGSLNKKK